LSFSSSLSLLFLFSERRRLISLLIFINKTAKYSTTNKNYKENVVAEEKKPLSRSEREALIKDKAGWVIVVFAALLAINTYMGGSNSSKVLNNTIEANNTWSFYQAKSIKQTLAEMAQEDAARVNDTKKVSALQEKIDRYEDEPKEGKKALMEKARGLEADRTVAKQRSPWYTFAGSLFQIAIVLLSASILAVNNKLYTASLFVGAGAMILMSQAIWLWIPAVI
jgi:tellurite resistance protein